MFVPFLISVMAIVVAGPLEIEGGKDAYLQKGGKAAIEAAWEVRKPVYKFND